MKKSIKIIGIVFLIVFVVKVCTSPAKKNTATILQTAKEVVAVTVDADYTNSTLVNPKIFGVNIGFALARELDKDSGFVQLLREMRPHSLRFPGGTVANYYHPHLPVYGYKSNEIPHGLGVLYKVQFERKENILYNFIRLAKQVNCGAVFCANVLTGTTAETLFVLDELSKNNIPIYGVELGNEFCLLPYRKDVFVTEQVYIDKIKNTAAAIRQKYPNLKIAVVAGVPTEEEDKTQRSNFMRQWNIGLSKVNFYDGYVFHYYAACKPCDDDDFFENVYSKNLTALAPFQSNQLQNMQRIYQSLYGENRKLWLTEWNVSNGEYLDNTFVQGAFVYEQFLEMIAINAKQNNYIDISSLHAIDGLITIFKGKQKPVFSKGNDNASVQYFAFKFLATTLSQNTNRCETSMTSEDKEIHKNLVCQVFRNTQNNATYLHFVNRSAKEIELSIIKDKTSGLVQVNSIEASVPWATAGKTMYEKKYREKVKPITIKTENIAGNVIRIAPYSFGYAEY